MMDIKRKVIDTIKKNNLIGDGAHIVIGLSGGPDSVCLFDVLCELAEEHEWKLYPVHINHKFRPGAAEEDAEYVRGLAASRGWPAAIFEVDCVEMAAREGLTAEEAGRKARYEAFASQARAIREKVTEPAGKAEDCSGSVIVSTPHPKEDEIVGGVRCDVHENVVIAVAQNANDQAETILFRILRGTGIDGLSGIAYKRYEGDIPVVRPLLDVPRKDIEEYLAARGIEPRIDHTNSEVTYTRNRIRLELIPYLAEHFNENIIETVNRLGRNAACDKDFIGQEAERALASVWAAPAACGSGAGSQTQLAGLPAAGWHGQADRPASAAQTAVDSVPARQDGTESSLSAAAGQVEILVAPARTLHRAVRIRIYTMLLKRVGLEENITAAALSQIDDVLFAASPSAMTEIAGGYVVARVYDKLRFYKAASTTNPKMSKTGSAPEGQENQPAASIDSVPSSMESTESTFSIEYDKAAGILNVQQLGKTRSTPGCAAYQVSADEYGFTITTPTFAARFALTEEQAAHIEIRKRRAGDHIAIKIGGQIKNKKLSDFFVDEKVPKLARDDINLLALGSDILWIMPSEHFASEPLRSKGRFSAKYKAKDV